MYVWLRDLTFRAALGRRVVYAVRMPTLTQQAKALLTAGAVTTGKLFGSFFSDDNEQWWPDWNAQLLYVCVYVCRIADDDRREAIAVISLKCFLLCAC